jgi:hypothetical protein
MEILNIKNYEKQLNNITFTDYYYKLKLLATSVFEWEGLPSWMDEKWIESFLFEEGECMIFEDEERGLMISKCVQNGNVNTYGEPTVLSPAGIDVPSEKSFIVDVDCVHIRNNDFVIPTAFFIKQFAYRLAEISRTIDVNVNAQKTPVLVLGSEKQKLTLKQVYSKWEGNEPVIFGDKSLEGLELIRVLKTDAPVVFPQLQTQKQNVWNECLTFLGINNANTDKKERLITGEVEANDVHIDLSADCFLKARERACEKLNELFGTNISVKIRENMDKEVDAECMQDTQNFSET